MQLVESSDPSLGSTHCCRTTKAFFINDRRDRDSMMDQMANENYQDCTVNGAYDCVDIV